MTTTIESHPATIYRRPVRPAKIFQLTVSVTPPRLIWGKWAWRVESEGNVMSGKEPTEAEAWEKAYEEANIRLDEDLASR